MGKKVTNPIQVTATFLFVEEDGEPAHVDIIDASMHYGTSCEYGSLGRKGMQIVHTPENLVIVKDMFEIAAKETNAAEGIPEPDYGIVQWQGEEPE